MVYLSLECSFECAVRIIGSQKIRLPDEEAFFVVVGIHKPAGNAVSTVTADFSGIRVKYIHAVYLYADLARLTLLACIKDGDVRFAEMPVFLSSSDMCRSAFMRALSTGMRPSLLNSVE
jgi:hypothetical protein